MKTDIDNDGLLAGLRDLQDRQQHVDHMPFDEWRHNGGLERDIADLIKARSGVAGMANIAPGFGMTGSMGTSSRAPAGPNRRRSGLQGVGVGGDQGKATTKDNEPWFGNTQQQQYGLPREDMSRNRSKYNVPIEQPPPFISDVDTANIWYSPMEPVWPFGPPNYNRPREWNFPVGYNLNFIQNRMENVSTLRGMRASWGVLSTVIQTRKAQLTRLPWTLQVKNKPRQNSKGVQELQKFFKRPDGKLSFLQWTNKLLDDAFVIDAPTVFIDRLVNGKPHHAEAIDGGMIFPLIDDMGRRPDTEYEVTPHGLEYIKRQPAFQQIVYGLPMVNLSEDQLIYAMQNPLPDMPMFGYSPVQQIMIEATEAIRKTFYQLEFWRSGSMPELMVTVPDAWSPRQIAQFQGHFDALLSGQLSLKSKVRFIPGGMKPFDIKNASGTSLWSERDEMLVRLVCYAFSVSPTAFVKQTNRGTASNQSQSAQEEGLYPLMSWFKDDIMDNIIQEKFGYDDIEFVFQPQVEIDQEKRSKIHQIKLMTGEMTIDEARAENGEEPLPNGLGAVPLIYSGSGAIRLEDVINGTAMLPGAQPNPSGGGDAKVPTSPVKPNNTPQRGTATSRVSANPSPVTKARQVTYQHLKDASREAHRDPTKQQKKVGNYRKGHISIQGLPISIENAKGSRRGSQGEKKWEVKLPAVYGYIKGFVGADDDHIDVFVGKAPQSPMVYVIDQSSLSDAGKALGFDEHKCMIGYKSPHKAVRDYRKAFSDDRGLTRIMAVTALSMIDFKKWLKDGNLQKPIADQGVGTVLSGEELAKADTVSASSGFGWYDQTVSAPESRKRRKRKIRTLS